jgi:spore coat protein U-like protein
MKRVLTIPMIAGLAFCASGRANAATVNATLSVQMTIAAQCVVTGGTLTFPAGGGIITDNVDTSANITVQCTNTTPYSIALDAGMQAASGATTAMRRMISGSNLLNYTLYQDAARQTVWGDSGAGLLNGTGNGAAQTLTIYGRVPAQVVPAGNYADSVKITVTY